MIRALRSGETSKSPWKKELKIHFGTKNAAAHRHNPRFPGTFQSPQPRGETETLAASRQLGAGPPGIRPRLLPEAPGSPGICVKTRSLAVSLLLGTGMRAQRPGEGRGRGRNPLLSVSAVRQESRVAGASPPSRTEGSVAASPGWGQPRPGCEAEGRPRGATAFLSCDKGRRRFPAPRRLSPS